MSNPRIRRRFAVFAVLLLIVLLCAFGRPAFLWIKAWRQDRPVVEPTPQGIADDASRMNPTQVADIWPASSDPEQAEKQLRELLARAHRDQLKVSIAGAKHSMGGHTFYPGGVVIDMLPFRRLELDARRNVLTAGAGARWSDIVPFLDAHGLSVGIMQSNNDFTVGGSLSVNCHGWQHNRPPIASTVESFRIMTADGKIRRCSRTEDQELFSLALGGYGLFGIILDAELRIVPNERYRPDSEVIDADRYPQRFGEMVNQGAAAGMVYGRLCVAPGKDDFLKHAILTVFRQSPCAPAEVPALKESGLTGLKREVFRAQIGSERGKLYRWRAEQALAQEMQLRHFSRNQLLNEGSEVFREQNAGRTDILHEYFVPPDRVPAFLERMRQILPRHNVDLLNVTVRNVLEDKDTFLRYADREMFAFVMLFNQERSEAADEAMAAATREMIDAALECGGRYYLPYRPHATVAQFRRAYSRAERFFEQKRSYDPMLLFQNQFFAKYAQ
jgi:FAD/FMN-containing dehydrogenase